MASPPKVLVIGDDTRSFLACVRSLGRQGLEVHAAPFALDAPALRSRYIHQVHLLPYYLEDGSQWLAAMQALLNAQHFAMVLPCEERSLLPLFAHQSVMPASTVLAIPNAASLAAFFDKLNTRQLAARCDVPLPRGHVWQATSSVAQVQAELGFPMAAKHRQSYRLAQLYVRTQVRLLDDAAALTQWLHSQQPAPGAVFFEQVFAGIGLGVSVLCHQGRVLQAFEHHRANELAGTSYYRKSMPLDAARLQAVARMVAAVGYTGLAMFEFKLNPDTGQWVLLEVNARPWGSLPLPVAWGVDFPYRLYQLLCQQQVTPATPYPAQRYNRNLISDVWQMRVLAAQLRGRPARLTGALLHWLSGFGRLLLLREKQDVLVLDDPAPAWAEIRQFVAQRLSQAARPGSDLRDPRAAMARLKDGSAKHLLFICQGNICRSPYAASAARSIFNSIQVPVTVDSSGMLPRNRRPCPPIAVAAARASHVDLTDHWSKCTDAALVSKADLIIVFDAINVAAFLQRHPQQRNKLLLLSAFDPATDAAGEIADPDGKDIDAFRQTYATIARCITHLAQQIKPC